MKKRKIIGVVLGVTLFTSYGFQHSATANINNASSDRIEVSGSQNSEAEPHFLKKAAVFGGKFVLKQLTSAWAADQWSQTSVKKEYELNREALETLFDQ
ncbi:hypothetical protein ACIGEL_19165 [Rossellomorea aquimaris]|uniref:hypothetical protein n=1 Tax=Rossellomorea aquimaris TaxID=189382 RepID=UPI0037C53030